MRAVAFLILALVSQSVFAKAGDDTISDSRKLQIASQILSETNVAYTELALAKDTLSDKMGKFVMKAYSLVAEEVENQDVTPVTFVNSAGFNQRCLLFISPTERTATLTSCETVQKIEYRGKISL